jgi:hypothetical protein
VRAGAGGLARDGDDVDVPRGAGQFDGFFGTGRRGVVAGAGEDVEALGCRAVVDFVEGFRGVGAESGEGTRLVFYTCEGVMVGRSGNGAG